MKRTATMKWIDFTPILGRIKWAVIGAVATRHYMPERRTQDIDIIIHKSDGQKARKKLQQAGFKYKSELLIGGSSWIAPNRKSVDVLEGHQPWLAEALTRAKINRDKQDLPILPFHYLVLMKFQSGRAQDLADVTRMLGQADDTAIERAREAFRKYEPEGLQDLESMITLGKLEMGK